MDVNDVIMNDVYKVSDKSDFTSTERYSDEKEFLLTR